MFGMRTALSVVHQSFVQFWTWAASWTRPNTTKTNATSSTIIEHYEKVHVGLPELFTLREVVDHASIVKQTAIQVAMENPLS